MTKITDNYHTLQVIPAKFLSDLQNDPTMRGPGRLFLYLRRFIGSKYHPSTQRSLLTTHFSNYQINKYLSILVNRRYLRRDGKGNYYLTSLYKICPSAYDKIGRRQRTLCVSLDDQALRDGQFWKKYIAGIVVATYTRSLRYGKTAKRAAFYAATNDPTGIGTVYQGGNKVNPSHLANSSMVQGCALSILAKHTGKHKSTMSRWRKKGQAVGYSLGRWYYTLQYNVQPYELSEFRSQGGHYVDPNRFVIKAGQVVEEGPSQLIISEPIFFLK